MDNASRLQKISKAVDDAEKVVAVMESQKKELDETLKTYGFSSVEELESAITGLHELIEEEEERLSDKLNSLESKLREING